MLGGLGHTSFFGSNANLRGPAGAAAAVLDFFLFLSPLAEVGAITASVSRSNTASKLRWRVGLKEKWLMLLSSYFPGEIVSFMLSRFLWQVSQKAMLLA